jgi:hypothetical protein
VALARSALRRIDVVNAAPEGAAQATQQKKKGHSPHFHARVSGITRSGMTVDADSSTADTLRNPEAIMGTKAQHASIELCRFSTKQLVFGSNSIQRFGNTAFRRIENKLRKGSARRPRCDGFSKGGIDVRSRRLPVTRR